MSVVKIFGALLYFVPLVLSYFVVDRLFSRYYTGSWWKQPEDIEQNIPEKYN